MAQLTERSVPSPRRAQLVAAAARLFSERGYHGTSMRHLGDELGLLRGSLYAHTASKEELLFEVVDQGAERFLAGANAALEADAPAPHRLRALLVGHIEVAIDQIEAATVFLNEWRYLSDELRSIVQAKRDAYEGTVRRILSDGIETGEFRADLDIALAARLVLSAGNWVYTWYRPGGGMTPAEVGAGYADMLVKGFSAEEGSS